MSKINSKRNGCKDVFNAFLVSMARYGGLFEFPCTEPCHEVPNRLIAFSKAVNSKDYDQWVHFYEDDYLFERIWRNPKRYLSILKQYNGVILPDFSLYCDMPFAMQLWNIYRSRAIGNWLQAHGVKVIVNVRFGDRRTYRCTCDGVSKHCVIAVGSHGILKNKKDREDFTAGLDTVVRILQPSAIVVYGSAPDAIFAKYKDAGVRIVQFDSDYATSHKEVA